MFGLWICPETDCNHEQYVKVPTPPPGPKCEKCGYQSDLGGKPKDPGIKPLDFGKPRTPQANDRV